MTPKKISANVINCESLKKAISYDKRTEKNILFLFPFVDDGVIGQMTKFSWDGIITGIDAYCNKTGAEDTVIDIEMISEEDFNAGNDTWRSIFKDDNKIVIKANSNRHDHTYEIDTRDVSMNSMFRINFLKTGTKGVIDNTRIQGLTVQININITN